MTPASYFFLFLSITSVLAYARYMFSEDGTADGIFAGYGQFLDIFFFNGGDPFVDIFGWGWFS